MLALAALKTLGLNDWYVPISMERYGAGEIVMLAGTG
jgi:hypothetical protein